MFAHINNCHCITDSIYIYEKLLKMKHLLMEAKTNEIPTLLRGGFKKTEISK